MAIAFDADSNVAEGNGNLVWNHIPVGTPRGLIVMIAQQHTEGGPDEVTEVSYAGDTLTRIDSVAYTAAGQDVRSYLYFRGSEVDVDEQEVVVVVSGATPKRAVAVSLTAATDTEVEDNKTLADNVADPSVTLVTGASIECFDTGVLASGRLAVTGIAPGVGYEDILEHDFGAETASWIRRTTNSTGGNVTLDWVASGDRAAVCAVAIKESTGLDAITPITGASILAEVAPTMDLGTRPGTMIRGT